jgi:hypothetical protein
MSAIRNVKKPTTRGNSVAVRGLKRAVRRQKEIVFKTFDARTTAWLDRAAELGGVSPKEIARAYLALGMAFYEGYLNEQVARRQSLTKTERKSA